MDQGETSSKSASARIVGLYEANAAAWDRERGRDLHERPWLDRFLALVRPRGTILDLGCGMGEPIAAYLIARGHDLVGVDSSPSLIGLARTRYPGQTWLTADMRAFDAGREFDAILAWHSFFHLSPGDQRRMFARFAAHAATGAPLMFTSGWSHGEAIGAWHGEPLYHGSLDPDDYRALLADNGFREVAHVVRDPDCGEATIWLAVRT